MRVRILSYWKKFKRSDNREAQWHFYKTMNEPVRINTFTLLTATATVATVEIIAGLLIPVAPWPAIVITCIARFSQSLMLLFLVRLTGKGLESVRLYPKKWKKGIKRGLVWSFFFGLATLLVFLALRLLEIDPLLLVRTNIPDYPHRTVMFFIAAGFIGPIAEEILFRGIIYGFFRRWGIIYALLGSTLAFVSAHAYLSGVPLPQIAGGLLFALAYELEQDIMVPITIHVLGNLALLSLSLF